MFAGCKPVALTTHRARAAPSVILARLAVRHSLSTVLCHVNQVQVEVRKKWQHLSLTGFGSGLTSRRLATTTTTYAAVPGNESGVGQTGPGPADGRQLPAQQPPRRHQDHQQMDHPGRNSATEPMPASRPAELRDSSCQWHQTEAAAAGQQQE